MFFRVPRATRLAVGALIVVSCLVGLPVVASAAPWKGQIVFERGGCVDASHCGVFVMNADGSGQTRLGSGTWPAWSPDGSKIAFTDMREGDDEIYVMNADGSGVVQLTQNDAEDWDPAWSPDGAHIAFTSMQEGEPEIFVMDASGANQTNLTHGPAFDEMAAWSPDGTRIAFTRGGDIWVMRSDGSEQTPYTNTPSLADFGPDWSPDGSAIAFSSQAPDLEVLAINADGSNLRNLSNSPNTEDRFPTWGPKGHALAFSSSTDLGGNDENVWVMKAKGNEKRTQLTTVPVSWHPDWLT